MALDANDMKMDVAQFQKPKSLKKEDDYQPLDNENQEAI